MAHRKNPKKTKFLKELEKLPIIGVACSRAGISRATVYRWMDDDEDFADTVREARERGAETINDMAESQLIKGIKEGKHQSVVFWLRHNSDTYGPRSVKGRKKSIWERQPIKTIVEFVNASSVCDECGKLCDIEAHQNN